MSNKNAGIALPQVKRVATGEFVTEAEAKEISTQPQVITYEYAGLEFAMAIDPRKVSSEAEDHLQEVQLKMAEISDLDLGAMVKASDGDKSSEQIGAEVMSGMNNTKFREMAAIMREMENAQIDMLAPAVVGCNDPALENQPTVANLKKGGKLAKVQLGALNEWWSPTKAGPSAEETTTENQKSTD